MCRASTNEEALSHLAEFYTLDMPKKGPLSKLKDHRAVPSTLHTRAQEEIAETPAPVTDCRSVRRGGSTLVTIRCEKSAAAAAALETKGATADKLKPEMSVLGFRNINKRKRGSCDEVECSKSARLSSQEEKDVQDLDVLWIYQALLGLREQTVSQEADDCIAEASLSSCEKSEDVEDCGDATCCADSYASSDDEDDGEVGDDDEVRSLCDWVPDVDDISNEVEDFSFWQGWADPAAETFSRVEDAFGVAPTESTLATFSFPAALGSVDAEVTMKPASL
eukprot:gene14501-20528_t